MNCKRIFIKVFFLKGLLLEWDFIISKTLAHLKAESEYRCHRIFWGESASKKKREDDLWAYTSQYFPGIRDIETL